jgi:hypothetical protein
MCLAGTEEIRHCPRRSESLAAPAQCAAPHWKSRSSKNPRGRNAIIARKPAAASIPSARKCAAISSASGLPTGAFRRTSGLTASASCSWKTMNSASTAPSVRLRGRWLGDSLACSLIWLRWRNPAESSSPRLAFRLGVFMPPVSSPPQSSGRLFKRHMAAFPARGRGASQKPMLRTGLAKSAARWGSAPSLLTSKRNDPRHEEDRGDHQAVQAR